MTYCLLGAHVTVLILSSVRAYSKTCLKRPLKRRPKIGFQDRLLLNAGQKYCRMLQGEHSAILSTLIKLPFVFKTFVLSFFEWPLKTGFTVCLFLLQVQQYRFSISWSRIYPSGKNDTLNQVGVEHYRNLIDALKEAGIEPLPVLYHKDLPQSLQNDGGWLNPSIVQDFCNYAEECFRQFNSKVNNSSFMKP